MGDKLGAAVPQNVLWEPALHSPLGTVNPAIPAEFFPQHTQIHFNLVGALLSDCRLLPLVKKKPPIILVKRTAAPGTCRPHNFLPVGKVEDRQQQLMKSRG